MTSPQILTQLGSLQQMMRALLQDIPENLANRRFGPQLASLGWYLGRSVYRETYWLREILTGDSDLTDRVRTLFTPGVLDPETQCAQLPPPAHLLNWAAEIQDEHLRRLATRGGIPDSPLLENDRLQWFLLQEAARDYEHMLMVLHAYRMQEHAGAYRVRVVLTPKDPEADLIEVDQGHYRIGSRGEAFAYDNELPPQAVELSGFRIAQRPVSNAEFLAFMEAGGYEDDAFWGEDGRRWRASSGAAAPVHWRRDEAGNWYGIGLNGPVDLPAREPACGVALHEAQAFANWVASLPGQLDGAVLQHEYQWEVAARLGRIEETGRSREWCANPFHAYPEFAPFPDSSVSVAGFDGGQYSLRGASLHTQRCRRRASLRSWAKPGDRHGFIGIRLVFPPG